MMEYICDFGCGQEAKYQFKNGKWCCSKHWKSCPVQRKKMSEENNHMFGKHHSKESIRKIKYKTYEGMQKGGTEKQRKSVQKNKIKEQEKIFTKIIKEVEEIGEDKLLSVKKEYKDQYSKLSFKCLKCNHKYSKTWNGYRSGYRCPICGKIRKLKKLKNPTDETRRKMRTSKIKEIESKYNQVYPNYNPEACKLIEEYGEEHNYHFQHAENGGEYNIKELGYWVDGYDKVRNIVIEVDEPHHFNKDGNLNEKDVQRQKEITEFLGCKFIRLKISQDGKKVDETYV